MAEPAVPLPKPVHIEPSRRAWVDLDGASLRIRRPGQAPAWVPLRRLSRLTLSTRVEITMEALLACAERGIVIVVHDDREIPVARVVGRVTDRTGFRQRLADLTWQPDWRAQYHEWRKAMQHRVATVVARRLGLPSEIHRKPRVLAALLRYDIRRVAGEQIERQTRHLFRQQALSWTQHRLLQLGCGAEDELWLTGSPDLSQDLADLLAFRLETIRHGWLLGRGRAARMQGRPFPPLDRKTVMTRIERIRPRMDRLGRDLVNRFHLWLVERSAGQ